MRGQRGSHYYPLSLGIATLLCDRYACALAPGQITTRTLDVQNEIWVNADGDVPADAIDHTGRIVARGHLGTERNQTVDRRIEWKEGKPEPRMPLPLHLVEDARVYSICY